MPKEYISRKEFQSFLAWRAECQRREEEDRIKMAEERNRYFTPDTEDLDIMETY